MRTSVIGAVCAITISSFATADDDLDKLVGAMLGSTPIIEDLRSLTDNIGGRVTGSPSNKAAIQWALETFEKAGVSTTAEHFEMPSQWQELGVSARVSGDVSFNPRVVAKPFSSGVDGLQAPLVDAGIGTAEDFERLGDSANGA